MICGDPFLITNSMQFRVLRILRHSFGLLWSLSITNWTILSTLELVGLSARSDLLIVRSVGYLHELRVGDVPVFVRGGLKQHFLELVFGHVG